MSFAKPIRAACLGTVLATASLLAGCTFTPVYGDAALANQTLALTYTEPNTRLEQLVYRALTAKLGTGKANAPQLSAQVSITATEIGLAAVSGAVSNYQLTATVTYSVLQNGQSIANGSRSATAFYQTNGQIIADDAARSGAEEQAVTAAAETVRLALIADLTAK
ncbi:LPS assembly lipoprotein LptE [Pelagibacterium sp.]|uniref:LPS assembly lipoprotein LptE n=1 Tax=Pelagibacterium sp. TaxID=1967288 RepID=UPI003A8F5551